VDAHLGIPGIHVGPFPHRIPEAVADRVFDAQGDEFQALQGGLDGSHIDPDGAAHVEMLRPIHLAGLAVDVLFLGVFAEGQLEQEAGGDAGMEIGQHHRFPGAPAGDPAGDDADIAGPGGGQVFGEQGFQAPGTGGEQFKHGRLSVRARGPVQRQKRGKRKKGGGVGQASERLEHGQEDHGKKDQHRQFVKPAEPAVAASVGPRGEVRQQAPAIGVVEHQHQHQGKFGVNPGPLDSKAQPHPGAENHRQNAQGRHEAVQLARHEQEPVPFRPAIGGHHGQIDENPGQVEKTGVPADHKGDVQGFENVIDHEGAPEGGGGGRTAGPAIRPGAYCAPDRPIPGRRPGNAGGNPARS